MVREVRRSRRCLRLSRDFGTHRCGTHACFRDNGLGLQTGLLKTQRGLRIAVPANALRLVFHTCQQGQHRLQLRDQLDPPINGHTRARRSTRYPDRAEPLQELTQIHHYAVPAIRPVGAEELVDGIDGRPTVIVTICDRSRQQCRCLVQRAEFDGPG